MTPLEQWLQVATRGLSTESTARVRGEIEEHCQSAREAGKDAVAALGSPQSANRAYRQVLLTEREAMMAPVYARPSPTSMQSRLLSLMAFGGLLWLGNRQHLPWSGNWPLLAAIFCTAPYTWFYPPTTLERSRTYLYVEGVHWFLVVGVAWLYHGWTVALLLGVLSLVIPGCMGYQRYTTFRKLAAGQTFSLLSGEPQLTHLEAMYLQGLRNPPASQNAAIIVLFLTLGAMSVWQPMTFGPMFAWMAGSFALPRMLPIYTEARSRWCRIVKWTTMVIAAALPFLYGAPKPGAALPMLLLFFVLFDLRHIGLRRKLPLAEWPKRLYF